jgi:hypothetical protein
MKNAGKKAKLIDQLGNKLIGHCMQYETKIAVRALLETLEFYVNECVWDDAHERVSNALDQLFEELLEADLLPLRDVDLSDKREDHRGIEIEGRRNARGQ